MTLARWYVGGVYEVSGVDMYEVFGVEMYLCEGVL